MKNCIKKFNLPDPQGCMLFFSILSSAIFCPRIYFMVRAVWQIKCKRDKRAAGRKSLVILQKKKGNPNVTLLKTKLKNSYKKLVNESNLNMFPFVQNIQWKSSDMSTKNSYLSASLAAKAQAAITKRILKTAEPTIVPESTFSG